MGRGMVRPVQALISPRGPNEPGIEFRE
jgi:hypothetical protein